MGCGRWRGKGKWWRRGEDLGSFLPRTTPFFAFWMSPFGLSLLYIYFFLLLYFSLLGSGSAQSVLLYLVLTGGNRHLARCHPPDYLVVRWVWGYHQKVLVGAPPSGLRVAPSGRILMERRGSQVLPGSGRHFVPLGLYHPVISPSLGYARSWPVASKCFQST